MSDKQPILTLRRIKIACVISVLFFAPLLLVLVPLGFWVWWRDRHAPTARSNGPRPRGLRPTTDLLQAPFPPLGKSFRFQVPRANEFVRVCLNDQDGVDEELLKNATDNSWYQIVFSAERASRKGVVQLTVVPWGVFAVELDPDSLRPGLLPSVDNLIESKSDRNDQGGEIEVRPESMLKDGVGFDITEIECGATSDKNGIRIFFKAKGRGNVGQPQRREDVAFLLVSFLLAEREDSFLAPCADGKPEWSFDEVFFQETGIIDVSGDIAFVAQIVNHHGGNLSPESITPRSPVVTGIVRARSKTMPF